MEVDDQVDIVHVESSCRDVGRHEYLDFIVLEGSEGSCPLSLFEVAVEESRLDSVILKHSREVFGFVFGSYEHDNFLFSGFGDVFLEHFELIKRFYFDERMVDFRDRDFFGGLNEFVVGSDIFRQKTLHLFGNRRTERHGLFHLRDMPPNVVDIVDESHVEHTVALVKNKVFDLVEVDISSVDQIDQPSGSRNDDLRSFVDDFLLFLEARSAKNNRGADSHSIGKLVHFFPDLSGKFPGRGEDDRLGPADASVYEFQQGDYESGCFTGTGL